MNEAQPDHIAREAGDGGAPLPYEPPAIAWEEDWDVRANLASACAKQGGSTPECNVDPAS
jgi:hypothetical protein